MKIAPWIKFALLGFLGFGITNFLLGCIVDWSGRDIQASRSAPMLVLLAMGIAGLIGTQFLKRPAAVLWGSQNRSSYGWQ
jgi:hypothetical protein